MKAYHKAEKQFYHVLEINLEGKGSARILQFNDGQMVKKDVSLPEIILLSFTGKYAKEGKEIFEYDYIKYGDKGQWKGLVEWDKGRLTWLLTNGARRDVLGDIASGYLEVIGNYYQE